MPCPLHPPLGTGEVLVCETNTYILNGRIKGVFHQSTDAQGRVHLTGTTTTRGLQAIDEDGRIYRLHGAQGLVDTIRVVAHAGPGGDFERDRSTCES